MYSFTNLFIYQILTNLINQPDHVLQFSPISHLSPSKPSSQLQVKFSPTSVQLPFKQGLGSSHHDESKKIQQEQLAIQIIFPRSPSVIIPNRCLVTDSLPRFIDVLNCLALHNHSLSQYLTICKSFFVS